MKTEYCIELMIKEKEGEHPYITKYFFEIEDINKEEFMKTKKWEFEKAIEDLMGWLDVRLITILSSITLSDMTKPFKPI